MTKKEMIMAAIEANGYCPQVDNEGDVHVRYQMKSIYFMTGQNEEQYVSAILPQFAEVSEGEEMLTLAVCNKMTRELKFVKVYIDQTLKSVTASCAFFYTDMDSMKNSIGHALNILGVVRSTYLRTMSEIKVQ